MTARLVRSDDEVRLLVGAEPVLSGPAAGLVDADGAEPVAEWSATPLTVGGVWELTVTVSNPGAVPVTVRRADPLRARLGPGEWAGLHFTSAWGAEFAPVRTPDLVGGLVVETRSGRSSHGAHPWVGLERPGAAVIVAPAWSGNWHITLDPSGELTAGISPWEFALELPPGASWRAPSVVIAAGPDLEAAAVALTRAVARDLLPRPPGALPVEWNHWWPYEDAEIDEATFLANAAVAASLGIEVCTLDAGWFGRPDEGSRWTDERGDWDEVNTARFPHGLAALAGAVRERGAGFGVWVEAEALGAASRLRREHPELVATRSAPVEPVGYRDTTVSLDPDDPAFLGYVCLGSPAGRAHVAAGLDDVVGTTGATWLKLDFNVDPGAGCDRTDHGHGAGDGLLRHYEGLYAVLDAFRRDHPDVVLEACSSGGLRIDLGLARHVHCFFLSDPDWTEHHLQVEWAAGLLLPPVAMLHWSWSPWRGEHPGQAIDVAALTPDEFGATLLAASFHRFGISQRLPELPGRLRARLAEHVELYRDVVAEFVRDGTLHRLTGQPLRGGGGPREVATQLSLDDDRHLLRVIRLPADGGPPRPGDTAPAPRGLRPDRRYSTRRLAPGLWLVEHSGD
ncbi:alpha-galactosidase [Jiangella anatolica]|uniref:alpha-galactosidase n=1 Tax=Jiangella anatolica TaxID=2670374 RepID=A0A2W2AYN8_9ACTN|nr:alpha-galactosidase [Jiangella anatolica]PZF80325.1 alpha-galactosidase [Jiangella anatolica]